LEEEACPSSLSNADLLDALAFIHGAILDSPDEVRRTLSLDRIFDELSRELLNRGVTKTMITAGRITSGPLSLGDLEGRTRAPL